MQKSKWDVIGIYMRWQYPYIKILEKGTFKVVQELKAKDLKIETSLDPGIEWLLNALNNLESGEYTICFYARKKRNESPNAYYLQYTHTK
jgi:hypothetical protein